MNYATADGTAITGSDYTATSGVLTFNPGDTTKTITVNVIGDTTVEPDETFFVKLTLPSGATLDASQGTGTIVNDDTAPPVISTISPSEGSVGTTVAITGQHFGNVQDTSVVRFDGFPVTASLWSDGKISVMVPGGMHGTVDVSVLTRGGISNTLPFTTKAAPPQHLTVNKKPLPSPADSWVRYVAANVVPQLLGDRAARIQTAARVSFWGLQQGIFDLSLNGEKDASLRGLYPFAFSICSELDKNGKIMDVRLNALDPCLPITTSKLGTVLIWQVGLAGAQVLSSNRLSETSARQQQVLTG